MKLYYGTRQKADLPCNPADPPTVYKFSNDRRFGKPVHPVRSAAGRRLVCGGEPIAHDRQHHHRLQFGVPHRGLADRAVRRVGDGVSQSQANALGLESGMRKLSSVVLCGIFIASAFAQEAANPKPAPERNNGAFVAIFCSFIGAGICIMAALQASRSKQAGQKGPDNQDSGNSA